ncbi:uncharacterized protein LJ206_015278 isoform 1-T1 [Theristicus caerulescens]
MRASGGLCWMPLVLPGAQLESMPGASTWILCTQASEHKYSHLCREGVGAFLMSSSAGGQRLEILTVSNAEELTMLLKKDNGRAVSLSTAALILAGSSPLALRGPLLQVPGAGHCCWCEFWSRDTVEEGDSTEILPGHSSLKNSFRIGTFPLQSDGSLTASCVPPDWKQLLCAKIFCRRRKVLL